MATADFDLPGWARRFSALAGLLLWTVSMVGVDYWLIYGQEFTQSTIPAG
ncbi:hypothetical protein [Aestuariirhabdus litorea]|nr:hypothetical protein [Aestuariirhabdus litorea]